MLFEEDVEMLMVNLFVDVVVMMAVVVVGEKSQMITM